MKKSLIVLIMIISLLPNSALAQKYERPRVETPVAYRGGPAQPDAQSLADAKWFEVFKDEKLQELIREALNNNYDVRAATANINLARANLGITRSDQFPTFVGSADLVTQRLSRSGSFDLPEPVKRDRTFGSVLLNLLNFELDIWGRLRKATAAARADL
ncbi:MAG TPA: TolC family protein, partial [Pyrinomonadaceae bacterium]|nr:TolC family protein [Pyrinomonadaceae bacterium]